MSNTIGGQSEEAILPITPIHSIAPERLPSSCRSLSRFDSGDDQSDWFPDNWNSSRSIGSVRSDSSVTIGSRLGYADTDEDNFTTPRLSATLLRMLDLSNGDRPDGFSKLHGAKTARGRWAALRSGIHTQLGQRALQAAGGAKNVIETSPSALSAHQKQPGRLKHRQRRASAPPAFSGIHRLPEAAVLVDDDSSMASVAAIRATHPPESSLWEAREAAAKREVKGGSLGAAFATVIVAPTSESGRGCDSDDDDAISFENEEDAKLHDDHDRGAASTQQQRPKAVQKAQTWQALTQTASLKKAGPSPLSTPIRFTTRAFLSSRAPLRRPLGGNGCNDVRDAELGLVTARGKVGAVLATPPPPPLGSHEENTAAAGTRTTIVGRMMPPRKLRVAPQLLHDSTTTGSVVPSAELRIARPSVASNAGTSAPYRGGDARHAGRRSDFRNLSALLPQAQAARLRAWRTATTESCPPQRWELVKARHLEPYRRAYLLQGEQQRSMCRSTSGGSSGLGGHISSTSSSRLFTMVLRVASAEDTWRARHVAAFAWAEFALASCAVALVDAVAIGFGREELGDVPLSARRCVSATLGVTLALRRGA